MQVVNLVLEYSRDETLAEKVNFFALECVELNSQLRWSFDQA